MQLGISGSSSILHKYEAQFTATPTTLQPRRRSSLSGFRTNTRYFLDNRTACPTAGSPKKKKYVRPPSVVALIYNQNSVEKRSNSVPPVVAFALVPFPRHCHYCDQSGAGQQDNQKIQLKRWLSDSTLSLLSYQEKGDGGRSGESRSISLNSLGSSASRSESKSPSPSPSLNQSEDYAAYLDWKRLQTRRPTTLTVTDIHFETPETVCLRNTSRVPSRNQRTRNLEF